MCDSHGAAHPHYLGSAYASHNVEDVDDDDDDEDRYLAPKISALTPQQPVLLTYTSCCWLYAYQCLLYSALTLPLIMMPKRPDGRGRLMWVVVESDSTRVPHIMQLVADVGHRVGGVRTHVIETVNKDALLVRRIEAFRKELAPGEDCAIVQTVGKAVRMLFKKKKKKKQQQPEPEPEPAVERPPISWHQVLKPDVIVMPNASSDTMYTMARATPWAWVYMTQPEAHKCGLRNILLDGGARELTDVRIVTHMAPLAEEEYFDPSSSEPPSSSPPPSSPPPPPSSDEEEDDDDDDPLFFDGLPPAAAASPDDDNMILVPHPSTDPRHDVMSPIPRDFTTLYGPGSLPSSPQRAFRKIDRRAASAPS